MEGSFFTNQTLILICLILSVLRIYLELIRFNFSALPLTAKLPHTVQSSFHRTGLYLSVGYIILFAPSFLLST